MFRITTLFFLFVLFLEYYSKNSTVCKNEKVKYLVNKKKKPSLFSILYPTYPSNIDYIGRGYDVYTGNPLDTKVDEGFRYNLFKLDFFINNANITEVKGVDILNTLSCKVTFKAEIMGSKRDVKKKMDFKVGTKASVGSGKTKLAAKDNFKFSNKFKDIGKKMKIKKHKFVVNNAHCDVYKAMIDMYSLPELSNEFSVALKSFPNVEVITTYEEMSSFIDFYRSFGTHIVLEAVMGSELEIVYEISSVNFKGLVRDGIDIENAGVLSSNDEVKKNDDFGSTGESDIDDSPSFKKDCKAADKFNSVAMNKNIYSKGARTPHDGSANSWAAETTLNPVPIRYELTLIYNFEFVNKNNELQYLIPNKNDRDGLRTALDYYKASLSAEDTKNLPKPDEKFLCPGHIYGDKCIYYSKQKISWFNARMACMEWGGDLMEYRDTKEELFVKDLSIVEDGVVTWMSLNNLDDPKEWRWVKGNLMTFNHFDDNSEILDVENCVTIDFTKNGWEADRNRWRAQKCDSLNAFVCERYYNNSAYLEYVERSSRIPCDGLNDFYHDGYCIRIVDTEKVDYYEAKEKCKEWSEHSTLSIVNSHKKHLLIGNMIKHSSWIGLNDLKSEGKWVWENGALARYTSWAAGQPSGIGNQDCVVYFGRGKGWSDIVCDAKRNYICERPYFQQSDEVYLNSSKVACNGDDEVIHDNLCIKPFEIELNMVEAENKCKEWSKFGSLVKSTDVKKNAVLGILAETQSWIGLSDLGLKGLWEWNDGKRLHPVYLPGNVFFTKWCPGEPLNEFECVTIGHDGCWKTTDCSYTKRFICERPYYKKETDYNEFCDGNLFVPSGDTTNPSGVACVRHFLDRERTSWNEAQLEVCSVWNDDSNLVTIESAEKNQFIIDSLDGDSSINGLHLIGYMKEESGLFEWIIDGVDNVYQNWFSSETPLDSCAAMCIKDTCGPFGKWTGINCEEKGFTAICEFHYE